MPKEITHKLIEKEQFKEIPAKHESPNNKQANNIVYKTNNNENNNISAQFKRNNEIQNVESFFQKYSPEKENEVNKLFEDKKDPKIFYEECCKHFIRNNQIQAVHTLQCKPNVKSQNKNTITQQPQVNFNQTNNPSLSTNKNFPQKNEKSFDPRQHPQSQQEYSPYGQQQQGNPFMYPYFYYPQANPESNMTTNPQFVPQMMPQMMYMNMMPNYMVIIYFNFSILSNSSKKSIRISIQ